jgi:hypothetical protein
MEEDDDVMNVYHTMEEVISFFLYLLNSSYAWVFSSIMDIYKKKVLIASHYLFSYPNCHSMLFLILSILCSVTVGVF